jgi:uncharacterized membrane protein
MRHLIFVILLLALLAVPSGMSLAQQDVGTTIESFFASTEQIFMSIAGFMVVIAFFGLAFMYLGSSLPIISDWKKDNPKAANNVVVGLIILLFISGGTLGSMITF